MGSDQHVNNSKVTQTLPVGHDSENQLNVMTRLPISAKQVVYFIILLQYLLCDRLGILLMILSTFLMIDLYIAMTSPSVDMPTFWSINVIERTT